MEYINFGKVVNVSASVPVAANDTVYHIIIDFVPNCPEIFDSFHTDMGKILEWPDDYVLCNVSDIKELEDLGADLNEHIKNLERIKEFLINGNTTLIDENSKLKKELEDRRADQKKKYDKKLCIEDLKKQAEQIEELEKDRDYWKDRFGSVVIDVSKVLEANGVEFTVKAIDGNKWNVIIDIPELNEAKKKITDLEQKLEAAKSNVTYWYNRKEDEEEFHHYWWHTYNLAVAQAANTGVRIFINGVDKENNVGVIQVKNEKVEEFEAKWSAMLQALKEKGVEVIYMGEEDGKPNIDVKIPEIGDLKKELDDLNSKTVAEARYEIKPGCLTLIFTMCDGSEQVFGMDSSEAIDATSISCGTVPKCSSCSHFMHNPSRFAHDWCYMPIPKEGGAGYIRKLNKEEAEGPACSDFKAKE